ncbi:Tyrosine-protein kinase [Fasciola hepatica]|uniref:Tyrosine-protein kinase n=1 Tax=Fasciola hepatica TaxID=6192 RepID=A0A4E0QUN5_FASHE|nr:Tyrosine-protein kinase [Fasciola hepatica]
MTQMGVAYKAGDIVSATYSFRKDKNEDLSFDRNDKLKIINIAKDSNWAHAKNSSGETGLIPLNYVQPSDGSPKRLTNFTWYHGRITRPESEKVLSGQAVGSFLVRDSDLYAGDLTLCVVGPPVTESNESDTAVEGYTTVPATNVQHYHIIRKQIESKKSADGSQFSAISSITHYSLDEFDWFSSLPDLIRVSIYYSAPTCERSERIRLPSP